MLRCFLDPTKMIKFEEVPNPTNPNAQRLEVTSTGVRPKVQSGKKEDALWDFFNNVEGTCIHSSVCTWFTTYKLPKHTLFTRYHHNPHLLLITI